MSRSGFMIYGAYGYTGELIARQAVARGHRPLLAGRRRSELDRLASELRLDTVCVALEDTDGLVRALEQVDVVCHAAGPFLHTSAAMLEACLAARTSYVDITGEIGVFRDVFARHAEAERAGIALLPGAGFDVVPSDCLARFVADAVPDADELVIAFASLGRPSAGTAKASFEGVLRGNFVRRGGQLSEIAWGEGVREVRFSDRARTALPIPWGDLETAYRTTGIPNITTLMAVPEGAGRLLALARPVTTAFLPTLMAGLGATGVRELALSAIERYVKNPDARARQAGRAYLWARASAPNGAGREAWLETVDGYALTAESAVLALEKVQALRPVGALTPARAFGADFVLEIGGSVRHER
ncbi:MAG TPA: saccharopine dehydrogenase NADP-binding domain-containing protein, partial [Polyangiaceae bacterium]|nr:saccharopine dehydrogenase NADP-binding domain-containing protein [Polyangiaceae bacterium]